jgi:hypothetical protein
MRYREILKASNKHFLSYINTLKESSLKGLPELATLFKLNKFDLSKLIKQFRARKAKEKSYNKRFNTLSLKLNINKKLYKSSKIAIKE